MTVQFLVVIAVISVLISASLHDICSREIPDHHWWGLCILAVIYSISECGLYCGCMLSGGFLLLASYLFFERIVGYRAVIVMIISSALLIVPYFLFTELSGWVTLSMSGFILIMYHSGVIRGGADAKCLVCLSMVFPYYPEIGQIVWVAVYPEGFVFNPVFSILFLSLLISSSAMLYILRKNLACGRIGFTSYPMSLEEARSSFVWPLEDFEDGKKVLVTPMIPFLVPITIATSFVLLFGSPLFALI